MHTVFGVVGVALVAGLVSYAGVRLMWPTIEPQNFSNVIGLVALIAAGAYVLVARHLARRDQRKRKPTRPSRQKQHGQP